LEFALKTILNFETLFHRINLL